MNRSLDPIPVIRQEKNYDHKRVFELVETAFKFEPYSDQKEQFLVNRLRTSNSFVPELSLVATIGSNIIGFILLTRVSIKMENKSHQTLALAPIAVHPDYQKQGIGGLLMRTGHDKAASLGYDSIVLVGHKDYYPKFGYQLAERFGISFPFDVPRVNSFVKELKKGALKEVTGEVVYPEEFFEK